MNGGGRGTTPSFSWEGGLTWSLGVGGDASFLVFGGGGGGWRTHFALCFVGKGRGGRGRGGALEQVLT